MAKAKKPTKKTSSTGKAKAKPKQGTKNTAKAAPKKSSPKPAKPLRAAKTAASAKPKLAKKAKGKGKLKSKSPSATKRKATTKAKTVTKKAAPAVKAKAKNVVGKVHAVKMTTKSGSATLKAKTLSKAHAKANKTAGATNDRAPAMSAALAGPSVYLRVGDQAPEFLLPAEGAEGGSIQLSRHRGLHNVILYFYPKDDTSGCTKQACSFQNHLEQFHGCDAKVVGISPDNLKSHGKFRAKYELHFPLAADLGAEVAQRYGVWVPKSMYGRNYMGIQRTTFLIDKTGHIVAIWPKVKVDGHSDEVLDALRLL